MTSEPAPTPAQVAPAAPAAPAAAAPAKSPATWLTVMDSLQHPRVVSAFLSAPGFASKLPPGLEMSLKANYPVLLKAADGPATVRAGEYTWAITYPSPNSSGDRVAAAAVVDVEIGDDELDFLDAATSGKFLSYYEGEELRFRVGEDEVKPGDKMWRVLNFALEGGALANAAGRRVVMANGPRWFTASVENGQVVFSPSYGARKDGSEVAEGRATTTMYGALVAHALEKGIVLAAEARRGKQ